MGPPVQLAPRLASLPGMPSSPVPKPPSSQGSAGDRQIPDELWTATASPVETLLRGLLAVNGRKDAESRVVDGVRSFLAAAWVALYQEAEGVWACQAVSRSDRQIGEALSEPPVFKGLEAFPEHEVLAVLDAGEAALVLPISRSDYESGLLLAGPRTDGRPHDRSALSALARLSADLALVLRNGEDLDQLRSLAFVDALTNCYNRRGFDEHLHVELLRAQRYKRPLSLVLVDLDAFKGINDQLGHQAGDEVLRRFAALLTSSFRTTDIVSRYGGDEFALIFPETTRSAAVLLAERMRVLIRSCFPDQVISRVVTASFGVAAYPIDASGAEALVRRADQALYAAKTSGRDRVVLAEQQGEGTR